MKILIYGINYSPELTGVGVYTSGMTKWLASKNHECRVITAHPYYPEWKIQKDYNPWLYTKETNENITVFRCPLWIPKKPNTLSRVLHLASFMLSSLPVLIRNSLWKPNIILCIEPTFICTPQALIFAKLTGTKSWLHIQDFEIDAMHQLGFLVNNRILKKAMLFVERLIMKNFSRVSSISNTMCLLSQKKGVSPDTSIFFPNWTDVSFMVPKLDSTKFRETWGFNAETKIVLYSGNIGKKQGLDIILDIANDFRDSPKIQFIIVGDGVHKSELVLRTENEKLDNVHFFPLQPYHMLPDLLSIADIHLVIQKKGAADIVMPSKVANIFSAGGHAIITTEESTELGQLVINNPGIATLVPAENAGALSVAIQRIFSDTEYQNVLYNKVARKYAEEKLSSDAILNQFKKDLHACVNDTNK